MMSRDMSHDFHQVAKKYLSLLRFILIYDLDFDLSWFILITIKLNTCHFWIIQVKKGNEKKIQKND